VIHDRGLATGESGVHELDKRQTDVASNLSHEEWRDISASVERHGRCAPVGMSKLFVGAALTDFTEAEALKSRDYFACVEHWTARHDYATWTVCSPTNSEVRWGSPSSRSMATTSSRLC
jgi:hypothetical protein